VNANLLRRWVMERDDAATTAKRQQMPSPQPAGRDQFNALVLGLPWQRLGEAGTISVV